MSAAAWAGPDPAEPWDSAASAALDRALVEAHDDDGPVRNGVEQHRGQTRFAYRLTQQYGARLLHVHAVGWHAWDGTRWAKDENGEALRAVHRVLRRAWKEALGDKDLTKEVLACQSAGAQQGILTIAAALHPFAATVSDLDQDPYALNVANGTLDLRTGVLRPHDPDDRTTKVCRAAYHRDERGSGLWEAFLARVLPDSDVRAFVQRVLGVALIGAVREHVLPIWTGTGANGKGVTYGALLHALGDYAAAAEPDLFMAREGAHPTGQMDLRGRRFVVVSESDKDRRLAEATMKRLTGGDKIKARAMRQDFVEFAPSHLAVLVTNHLPKVAGDDDAIWRRMRVVPFAVVIPEADRDPHLGDRLELEADAILAWAVAGLTDYRDRGDRLDEPASVLAATASYRHDSDALARFVAEECIVAPALSVTVKVLRERWEGFCRREGVEPGTAKAFGQALDRRGLAPADSSGGARVRRGIGLRPDEDSDDGSDWASR